MMEGCTGRARKEEIRDCLRAQVAAEGRSEEAEVDTVEEAVIREV
jgi:hypothetical protein